MKVSQEEDHSGSKDNDVISLQIVESSQVDLDKKQAKMLANATHLTVDLVCSTLNYKQERLILLSMLI
jgi:hypothetical protein